MLLTKFSRRHQLGLTVTVLSLLFGGSSSLMGQESSESSSGESIEELIPQLVAEKSAVRSAAFLQVMNAGIKAVKPLHEFILDVEPKGRAAGVAVMARLATADDIQCAEAARTALQSLANSKQPEIRQLALNTMKSLGQISEDAAVDVMRAAGIQLEPRGKTTWNIEVAEQFNGDLEALDRLAWLSDRVELTWRKHPMNAEIMSRITAAGKLRDLTIRDSHIERNALDAIQDNDDLRNIMFFYVDVDDVGIEPMRSIKELRRVRLVGTDVSQSAAESLDQALPNARVDWRQGGFMGVVQREVGAGRPCKISEVLPDSGADRAGMLADDVIIEVNGQPVSDSVAFNRILIHLPPGEKVDVKVRRGRSSKNLQITLGKYPDPAG